MNPFRHLLDEINDALERHSAKDEADRAGEQEQLRRLRADVEEKLAAERPPGEDPVAEDPADEDPADEDLERRSQLRESLQDAEDRLQAEHPRLAQAIQQALRSLADAGL